ncbi:hypothetical protein [Mucilaginibacter phyllosphaerae]
MKITIKKLCVLTIAAFMLSFGKASAQHTNSVRQLIDTSLRFSKKNPLYSGQYDWNKIADSARAKALNADAIKEALPAVQLLYQLLGDHHGS